MDQGLASVIREARTSRDWSQTELAERAGISRPSIARIEAGHDVSMATLAKVGAALGLTLALVPSQRLKHLE